MSDAPGRAKPKREGRAKGKELPLAGATAEEPVELDEPAEDADEAALRALAGPVNFEAEPDVMEMLAAAPFAVPIPAKILAEKGIQPSEIAVAPVLNRAYGDLEVRSGSRTRHSARNCRGLPRAIARASANSALQVADVGFINGRARL